MDKETAPEETKYQNEEDFYNDEDDYVFGKVLKGGIKADPASARSRPRLIPLYKIQIADKDKIPKMPEKILPMPLTQEQFDRKIQEYKNQLKEKSNHIKDLFKEKQKIELGLQGEVNSVVDQRRNLFKQKKEIQAKLNEIDDGTIKKKLNDFQNELNQYDKFHFPTNLNQVQQEIKSIKESLSFSDLTINEEKKLNDRKNNLELYYDLLKQKVNYREKNKDILQKTGDLRKELKTIDAEIKKTDHIVKDAHKKQEKMTNNPEVNNIQARIDSLKEDKKKISQEMTDFRNDETQKWNEYNEQQHLIEYIKECKDKIKRLEDKEKEKLKYEKKKEKMEKEQHKNEQQEAAAVIGVVSKPKIYDQNIRELTALYDFFAKLSPETEESKKEETTEQPVANSHVNDKLKIKEKKKDEYSLELASSDGPKKKKKGKAPKQSGNRRGQTSNIILDIEILQKIANNNLSAPMKQEDIPKFLEELKKKKETLEKENTEIPEKETPETKEAEKEDKKE